MSQFSDRCKTDPDEDSEIKRKRKQVQQFIQNSKEEQKKLSDLFKNDLDLQSQKIKERIQKRNFKKPIAKSSSCGVYMSSNPMSESQSLADTEDYQETLYEDALLELDNQRDEKIYRIVQHYNNQINNLRMIDFTEESLQQMLHFEKKKWEEIQNIQEQYEIIKSNQIQQ
ncbi:unnamed protein product (macronuclear) [Paramecium tetraurelia]|uniref:Uncharacterized protein n=1 Tax=Paramecium tetraurelia TaxID=5888 RepID=A0DBB5_PARTE|nr:uncharacterized protein GSPATT00015226001 [Paramecium tetraurelia]CAK80332.1 unnamed protein product [Paramecium tetraurelia]|eukprot:XP_001447729.1 hypothetical protein (macronuclear) [Paramecium tetraurelia strain d4-2]